MILSLAVLYIYLPTDGVDSNATNNRLHCGRSNHRLWVLISYVCAALLALE